MTPLPNPNDPHYDAIMKIIAERKATESHGPTREDHQKHLAYLAKRKGFPSTKTPYLSFNSTRKHP